MLGGTLRDQPSDGRFSVERRGFDFFVMEQAAGTRRLEHGPLPDMQAAFDLVTRIRGYEQAQFKNLPGTIRSLP